MSKHINGELLYSRQQNPSMAKPGSTNVHLKALSKVTLLNRDHKATILGQSTQSQCPDHPPKHVHNHQSNKIRTSWISNAWNCFPSSLFSWAGISLYLSPGHHIWAGAAVAEAPAAENTMQPRKRRKSRWRQNNRKQNSTKQSPHCPQQRGCWDRIPRSQRLWTHQGKDFYNVYLRVRSARGLFTASVLSNDSLLSLTNRGCFICSGKQWKLD